MDNNLPDNNLLYENVFFTGKWNDALWARLWNPETKESIYKKFTNNQFVPPMYTKSKQSSFQEPSHTTFDNGAPLFKQTFKNTSEQRQFVKDFDKKALYGYAERRFHYIRETYPNSAEADHEMRINFLDIEVEVTEKGFPKPELANEQVTIIQMYDNYLKQYYIFGLKPWTGSYESTWGKVNYVQLKTEDELLRTFVRFIQKTNPAILTGFNSSSFDYPYLINRMRKLGIDADNLSPVGEIASDDNAVTKDGFKYQSFTIKGRLLVDYKDLIIKYAYLSVPTFSLENCAKGYGLEGKSKQKSYKYQSFNGNYSGEGWMALTRTREEVPEEELAVWDLQMKKQSEGLTPEEQATLDQEVFDTFMKYAIRDVEVMLEIDEKSKLINLAKLIAYMSGVTMDDVTGTLKFWIASMYNTAYADDVILPVQQQFTEDGVFIAGWVRSLPGKYKWITSFDIGSAHPHQHVNHNIGADSLILPKDLHPDLVALREKYFNFYSLETYPDLAASYDEPNDIPDETDYTVFLLNHAKDIRPVLEKHNVIATVNGYFYDKGKECYASKVMREGLSLRMRYKKEGKTLRADIEHLKENDPDNAEKLNELTKKAEYVEAMSLALKIRINSYYGADALPSNPFSNGRVTGACVAMSTRAVNKIQAIAVDRVVNKFLGLPQDDKLSHIKVCDTDSIYACIEKIVGKVNPPDPTEFVKKFSTDILLPEIYKLEKEFLDGLNVIDPDMIKFDNEVIAKGFISIAAKRYFGSLVAKDGTTLAKPKLKMVGISLISRSTPDKVKEILKPTLDMFLEKDELYVRTYVKEELQKFKSLKPKDICGIVGVSSLSYIPFFDSAQVKSWKQGNKFRRFNEESQKWLTAPQNSKGSLIHNELIKENNLLGKYEEVRESDKINVCYVQVPNPITYAHNIFAFKDPDVIEDLGLTEYIDYEKQWELEVLKKLRTISESLRWNVEDVPEKLDEW